MFKIKEFTQRASLYIKDYAAIRALSGDVFPGTRIHILEKRRKFRYRVFIHYRHYSLLKSLFNHQKLHGITAANPRIYDKIHRPYVLREAKPAQRFHILSSNYEFVNDMFSSRLINSVFIDKNFQLCSISFPDELGQVAVSIRPETKFEREGELTLGLRDQSGRYLYSITFSFCRTNGKTEALIGCIQGGMTLSESKQATKAMEGFRPQNLMIFLLREFCRYFKVDQLTAVGFQAQIYFDTKKQSKITFDYDSFWQELGGVQTTQDVYSISAEDVRKPMNEIPSKKRASYLRRFSLLDYLKSLIHETLREHSPQPE